MCNTIDTDTLGSSIGIGFGTLEAGGGDLGKINVGIGGSLIDCDSQIYLGDVGGGRYMLKKTIADYFSAAC